MAYTTVREAWDAIPAVRERMRHSQPSLVLRSKGESENSPCNKSVANARLNEAILMPYLLRMHEQNLKLPSIDKVLSEVHEFYSMCRVQTDATVLYNQAWSLRRLLQLIKARIYKPKPPQDRGTNRVGYIRSIGPHSQSYVRISS